MNQSVLHEKRGEIAYLTLNRPEDQSKIECLYGYALTNAPRQAHMTF